MVPPAKKLKLVSPSLDSRAVVESDSAMSEVESDEGNYDYSSDGMHDAGGETENENGSDSELEFIESGSKPRQETPVEPTPFKLSARKQFAVDLVVLEEKYGSSTGETVRGQFFCCDTATALMACCGIDFKREDEETITFTLVHSAFPKKGLKLVLMLPEVAGYPIKHQTVCYTQSEITPEIEAVMAEVATFVLPLSNKGILLIFHRADSRKRQIDPSRESSTISSCDSSRMNPRRMPISHRLNLRRITRTSTRVLGMTMMRSLVFRMGKPQLSLRGSRSESLSFSSFNSLCGADGDVV